MDKLHRLNADLSFVAGAHVASIITSLAGVETHLCGEGRISKHRLIDLISRSDLGEDLKQGLQILRKYRNKWVRVMDPSDDNTSLGSQERHKAKL